MPSSVSAIKIDGRRAYARVRAGEQVVLPARPVTVSTFTLLALLPDFDVALVALGMPDAGCGGHRGASHSFATALIIGLNVYLLASA